MVRWKKWLITTASAVLVAFLGGLIGAAIKGVQDRARPTVELTTVNLVGSRSKQDSIRISLDLVRTYELAPFEVEKWDASTTLERLQNAVTEGKEYETSLNDAKKVIGNIRNRLESLSTDTINKDANAIRVELLRKWSAGPGNILESLAQLAISRYEYLQRIETQPELKKYGEHPPAWKNPSMASVDIPPSSRFSLAEEILRPQDSNSVQWRKTIVNVFRRMWIYMEQDKLLKMVKEIETEIDSAIKLTAAFTSAAEKELRQVNPPRLHAVVSLTNYGGTPAIFKRVAFVSLSTSHGAFVVEMDAQADTALSDTGAIVIDAGQSRLVNFYSQETIDEMGKRYSQEFKIPSSSQGNNPIGDLYNTEALACRIAVCHMRVDGNASALAPAKGVTFGATANREIIDKLRKSLGL